MENEMEDKAALAEMTITERAKARVKGPGPYFVPFEFPFSATIKVEGGNAREETYEGVLIRRPGMKEITDAGDMAHKKSNSASLYWLVAKLTGLPESVIHKMDPDDFVEVEAIIEVFTQKFQRTEKTSSAT